MSTNIVAIGTRLPPNSAINPVKAGIQTIGAIDKLAPFNGVTLGNASEMVTYNNSDRPIKNGVLSSDVRNPGTAHFRGEHTIATRANVTARIGSWNPSYEQVAGTNYSAPNPWSSAIDVAPTKAGG